MNEILQTVDMGKNVITNTDQPTKRILVGIPMTGLLRAEWVLARYGQIIPCNWAQVDCLQWLDSSSPIGFMVADARNIIVDIAVKDNFEWLYFIDHDTILPQGTTIRLNERMMKKEIPMWSGLYFTKSRPAEPLVYRGRGNGYYADWHLGDEVWVDGIPMGCTMIHSSILRYMWEHSEEYEAKPGLVVRRVFESPRKIWYDPERNSWNASSGTEDLEFCSRIMREDIFGKTGWKKYSGVQYPFMIDTSIFCKHIDFDGTQYPTMGEELQFVKQDNKQ